MTEHEKNHVFSRSPYISGNSKVITVSGIPILSSSNEVNITKVTDGQYNYILIASYDDVPKHEMENMSDVISIEGLDKSTHVKDCKSLKGAKSIIDSMEKLEEGETLTILRNHED